MSNTDFSGYDDTGDGFYKVYSDIFNKIYKIEVEFVKFSGSTFKSVHEPPKMGNIYSPYEEVKGFYEYWLGFCTVMDFELGVRNMVERVRKRQKHNERVRSLAAMAIQKDKRVIEVIEKSVKEKEKLWQWMAWIVKEKVEEQEVRRWSEKMQEQVMERVSKFKAYKSSS